MHAVVNAVWLGELSFLFAVSRLGIYTLYLERKWPPLIKRLKIENTYSSTICNNKSKVPNQNVWRTLEIEVESKFFGGRWREQENKSIKCVYAYSFLFFRFCNIIKMALHAHFMHAFLLRIKPRGMGIPNDITSDYEVHMCYASVDASNMLRQSTPILQSWL